jgi:hypothetical protein
MLEICERNAIQNYPMQAIPRASVGQCSAAPIKVHHQNFINHRSLYFTSLSGFTSSSRTIPMSASVKKKHRMNISQDAAMEGVSGGPAYHVPGLFVADYTIKVPLDYSGKLKQKLREII